MAAVRVGEIESGGGGGSERWRGFDCDAGAAGDSEAAGDGERSEMTEMARALFNYGSKRSPVPPRLRSPPCLLLRKVGAIPWCELRRGGGQPPAGGCDGAASPVDGHLEGPPLWRRPGYPPRPRRHQHLRRRRRRQRRHPLPRRRPLGRRPLGLRQRPPVCPRHRHLRRRHRQRGPHLRRLRHRRPAPPRHAEPPLRSPRRRRRCGWHQGLNRQHHDPARTVRAAVLRRLPARPPPGAQFHPGLSAQHELSFHDQPVPVLRLPLRSPAGDAGVLPLPAERRPARRRRQGHVHEHVRRPGGRGEVCAQGRRFRRRAGHRRRRDRVAVQRGPRRDGGDGGEREGVQWQFGGASEVDGGDAADAREVGRYVHFCTLRRGPQARADVGAVVRALSAGFDADLRRRPGQIGLCPGELVVVGSGVACEDVAGGVGRRVVRAEGRGDGRGFAGEPGLRVLAAGRRLQPDPVRRRLLPPQHRPIPRHLRHEPTLPRRRPPHLGLRLPAVRYPHLHRPKLSSMRVSTELTSERGGREKGVEFQRSRIKVGVIVFLLGGVRFIGGGYGILETTVSLFLMWMGTIIEEEKEVGEWELA